MKTVSRNKKQHEKNTTSHSASTDFAVKSWSESTWEGLNNREAEGPRRTHAEVVYAYKGDVEGESTVHYLMNYNDEKSGQFVGLEYFQGKVHGREGSFVMRHIGIFREEEVEARITIQSGSASGELKGIEGGAEARIIGHMESYPMTLEYRLPV